MVRSRANQGPYRRGHRTTLPGGVASGIHIGGVIRSNGLVAANGISLLPLPSVLTLAHIFPTLVMHEPGRRAVLRRARPGNPMCACAKSGPPAAFGLSVRSPEMTVQFPYGSGLPTAGWSSCRGRHLRTGIHPRRNHSTRFACPQLTPKLRVL